MENIEIEKMLCFDKSSMRSIKIGELRGLCYKYGLNKHGTKSELCIRIKSFLESISNSKKTLTLNNIDKINNIDDFINLLTIDDINDIHNLSNEDIEFLWTSIGIDKLTTYYNKYKTKYSKYSDNDIKILSLVEFLSNQFCSCYVNNKKRTGYCNMSVIDTKNIRVSKFKCNDDGTGLLLPQYGKTLILEKK